MLVAKYLELFYEGFFMCRLATDPDPTNEQRGMSGYTMALATEDALDQVIRLQETAYVLRNYRKPAAQLAMRVGVTVREVRFDGTPYEPGMRRLVGARVYLDGRDGLLDGPTFESRNNIVGSDDTMAFVVEPFHMRIERPESDLRIEARDHVDPAHPACPLWQIDEPAIYARRLPVHFETNASEVSEALGVFDYYGYFRERRRWLQEEMAAADAALARATSAAERQALRATRQGLESRIYQLEFWGDRVIDKLGFQLSWAFHNNGPQRVIGDLGGRADTDQPWLMRFWFGGWDGDLLMGYMRGSMSIPFVPAET